MSAKVLTARAITAFVAVRFLKLVSLIALAIVAVLLIIITLLAVNISQWWWILAVPLAILSLVFLLVRFILSRVFRRIYRHPFTRLQRTELDSFTGKITRLVEARSTPLPIFALQTVWEVIRHRDAKTVRALILDSASLKQDFAKLERLFETK